MLTSDRPPSEIAGLKRGHQPLPVGMVADITLPDFEHRVAILKQKQSRSSRADYPRRVIYFIAEHVRSNVRSSKRDHQASRLRVTEAQGHHVEVAREALRDKLKASEHRIRREIRHLHFWQSSKRLPRSGGDRRRTSLQDQTKLLTTPRQIAMYLTREYSRPSWSRSEMVLAAVIIPQ